VGGSEYDMLKRVDLDATTQLKTVIGEVRVVSKRRGGPDG